MQWTFLSTIGYLSLVVQQDNITSWKFVGELGVVWHQDTLQVCGMSGGACILELMAWGKLSSE